MNLTAQQIWLIAFGAAYVAATSFWARQCALRRDGASRYLAATGELPSWMVALAMAALSLSAWVTLGLPDLIGRVGLPGAALALATIPMALFGAVTFKRQWQIGRRFGARSQAQLLAYYYRSRGFAWLSAGIATLFATAFTAVQLAVLGQMMAELSGGGIAAEPSTWLLALMTFSYVIVGGLYAAGVLGSLQCVLLGVAVAGLSLAAVYLGGGFAALNAALANLAQAPASAHLFRISGVVRFVSEADGANGWTAAFVLSTGIALAGVQASPAATQLLLSARDDRGVAAGQTWVLAAVFGGLCAFGLVLVGAHGMESSSNAAVADLLAELGAGSPWFMAAIYFGLVAGFQALAAASLVTAAQALVRDVFAPDFMPDLDPSTATLLGRICVGVLTLASVLLATRAPAAAVSLGALALPFAAQLAPALVGLCWLRWISPPAALVGAVVGVVTVALTDSLGVTVMNFVGLHLPWGRWPWTIHSAGWGLAANVAAALVISAITPTRRANQRATTVGVFLAECASLRSTGRGLKPGAWAAALAWLFVGAGPGLLFGNFAFGDSGGGLDKWLLGVPPLWGWCLLAWALGVVLVWLLAYKLELASSSSVDIVPLESGPAGRPTAVGLRVDHLHALLWALSGAGAVIAALAWMFGH
jgi:solute:Na+ symporter, SSS family